MATATETAKPAVGKLPLNLEASEMAKEDCPSQHEFRAITSHDGKSLTFAVLFCQKCGEYKDVPLGSTIKPDEDPGDG